MKSIQILRNFLQEKEPVTFEEFVKSPDFCGNPYIYDYWVKQESGIPVYCNELILDGSLGGGKSYFAAYYFAYRVYKMFLNGTPQQHLGLSPNTDIFNLYFSVSVKMAKKSGFQTLYDVFKTCKWFKENAPINTDLTSSIEFIDNKFYIDYASSFGHQIGLNIWGFILDEANFRSGVGEGVASEYYEVTELYQQLLDRQLSRLSTPDGYVKSLAILISSASYKSSFLEKRKLAVQTKETAKVITTRAYEAKPQSYSTEKFKVFIGYGQAKPRIMESEADYIEVTRSVKSQDGKIDDLIIEVPVNLKSSFEENIVLALQNHAGIAMGVQGSFMPSLIYLQNSYTELPHYFTSETLEASTNDNVELIEYLLPNNIVLPNNPHSLFLDLSVQHDTGALTCYRYDGNVDGLDKHTCVFALKIIPPIFPDQTSITKVQNFIIELASYLNIVAFGSDQYQCWRHDTLIPTEFGIKKISDITVGDRVFSEDKSLVSVINVFHYKAPVYKITLKSGDTIYCTDSHKVSVVSWGKQPLDVVKKGIGDRSYLNRKIKTPELGDSLEETTILYSFDDLTINEEMLLLGWLTGDGGISRRTPYLCFSHSEKYILDYFKSLNFAWQSSSTNKVRTSYLLRISSTSDFSKKLVDLFGADYRSYDKRVPFELLKTTSDVYSYLRGLYSSDGSITREQLVLTSVSKELLLGVKKLLRVYLGIQSTIVKSKRKYRGDYKNGKDIYHLRSRGNFDAFRKVGFIQDYKNNTLNSSSVTGKGFMNRVLNIDCIGVDDVYDLEVGSESHLYYTCTCLSHNSTQLRQVVNDTLGLQDIRLSIDSSDLPHLYWRRALYEGRIELRKDELLEKEVVEAIHDTSKGRVLKNKGSSDDLFQTHVGAFFLSDTFGKDQGTLEDLYGERVNIVGSQSVSKVLRNLGYSTIK